MGGINRGGPRTHADRNVPPNRMHRHWYSRRYDNAPMPRSIFFYKGYAIHGTNQIGRLGRPASKGCVRLHPSHAVILFALVKQHGARRTRIVITGWRPRDIQAG